MQAHSFRKQNSRILPSPINLFKDLVPFQKKRYLNGNDKVVLLNILKGKWKTAPHILIQPRRIILGKPGEYVQIVHCTLQK